MMKKSLLVLPLAAVLLLPGMSSAEHCSDVFIFFGRQGAPDNPVSNGFLNLGASGCNVNNESLNTNWITPGADGLIVGASGSANLPVTDGTISFDGGDPTPIEFAFNDVRGRWQTEVIDLPEGTQEVTATAIVNATGSPVENTVTYTAL